MAEVWRELLESRRRLFLAAAERHRGLQCVLAHAGPAENGKLDTLPQKYQQWEQISDFGPSSNGPRCKIILPPRAFDKSKRDPDGNEMTTPMFAEYCTLTESAGKILAEMPRDAILFPPDFVRSSGRQAWIQLVFYVTRQPREIWDEKNDVLYPWNKEQFQRLLGLFRPGHHFWRACAEKLPDYWLSECPDVFLASADGITLLLTQADTILRKPGTKDPTFKSGTADQISKVFISYAHSSPEHKHTISSLVDTLREKGLTVAVDTDVKTPQGPEEGWPKWMKRQIKEADWVLMFFDKLYRRRFDGEEEPDTGLGGTWEGAIITHHFYRDSTKNKKFIPLLADGASTDLIPDELFGYTRYFIPKQEVELATALRPHPRFQGEIA